MVTIENLYLSYFHMIVLCFPAQFWVLFYWLMVNLWYCFVILFFFWFESKMLFALANENLLLILFQFNGFFVYLFSWSYSVLRSSISIFGISICVLISGHAFGDLLWLSSLCSIMIERRGLCFSVWL